MERFSVKKPFTILVMVIVIITLGVVSVSRLSTDLLPEMGLPYLMVITPYPGASPEKIESAVAEPMERSLGTITGVKNVNTENYENYCMTQLEFEDGTDMDSALVKVSSAVEEVSAALPEEAGNPTILEISMDMLATMYLAVSVEDYDIYELSDYVRNDITPYLERQNGVARVSEIGLVEKSIHVELNQEKIDRINDRILTKTNKALEDAREKLDEATQKVEDGRAELEEQEQNFGSTLSSALVNEADDGLYAFSDALVTRLNDMIYSANDLIAAAESLNAAIENADVAREEDGNDGESESRPPIDQGSLEDLRNALEEAVNIVTSQPVDLSGVSGQMAQLASALAGVEGALNSIGMQDAGDLASQIESVRDALINTEEFVYSLPELAGQLQEGVGAMAQGQLDAAVAFSTATIQLAEAEKQLNEARDLFDSEREKALKNANVDSLLSASTLSQLIYAQNFSMPAGYIDDKNDDTWLLKVGDEYEDASDLSDVLLVDTKDDDIGVVRLEDVADITVIDNAGESYAKLNGKDAICLAVYKGSTAGTNDVCDITKKAMADLEEGNAKLNIVPLMDQGIYIDLIISSILTSILFGAALAILVLILFLRAVRPTLVVAISIPLSVLFAIVLMYFSGLSLNMMTLSGLALGIGMLVDNSIVVMENIFRLRSMGLPAPRAAVQGAKQVRGAIIASTLTTICVFFPMVFSRATVRELLIPLALSIGYCLVASLVVALTVVPAASSTLMKNMKPRKINTSSAINRFYEKVLTFCLKVKIVPLVLSILLLAATIMQIIRTGIVLIPEIASNEIQVDINTKSGLSREESYRVMDEVSEAFLGVDGVEYVGIIDGSSATALISSMTGDSSEYGYYMSYVLAGEDLSSKELTAVTTQMQEAADKIDNCKVTVQTGDISDLSAVSSQTALTVNIYGTELDEMKEISSSVQDIIKGVDGFTDVKDSSENGEKTLHLVIDKDKAMSYGFTVAQIYAEISGRLATSVQSTRITVNGIELDISIIDETDVLTRENLLDMEFEVSDDMTGAMSASEGFDVADMGIAEEDGEDENTEEADDSEENDENEDEEESKVHKLSEFAHIEETTSMERISRKNQTRFITVTAAVSEGENAALLTRELTPLIKEYDDSLPYGYSVEIAGQDETIRDMITQMSKLALLGLLLIYLVMVAQFQSLLSPFVVLFTVPLAFTGGMIGLMAARQPLSMLSLMGFLILMGTVVNNGIVFVDYANQLRLGGMERRRALIATGQTRMRPIFMTALTTILAMIHLIFGDGMGSQLGSGMAIVIVGGLLYATIMTLIIIPVMYDIFFKKPPLKVEVGEDIDESFDDAASYLAESKVKE